MTSKAYDDAVREQIRQRMSPPNREGVAEIARSTGITSQTLYNWRSQWKKQGQLEQVRHRELRKLPPVCTAGDQQSDAPAREEALPRSTVR
ncbi:MAG: transposase [Cyanobacteriota bacterium]|nr:transposase [Cyanobacteriota bacterium]